MLPIACYILASLQCASTLNASTSIRTGRRTHRNSHQDRAGHKRLDILRKERDEDETDHRDQRRDHREAISIPLRNNTVDEQAEDLANPCAVRETTLPRRSDLEFPGFVLDAELPVEGWECEE
jgi:hypothetical protein